MTSQHAATHAPTTPMNITRIVPVRHYGRWVGTVVVLIIASMIVNSVLTNPRYEWGIVAQYFTADAILNGILVTVQLTIIAMVGGIIIGVLLAVMRLSPNPVMRTSSWAYIAFFRGTPLLVQLIFWFNLAALFPHLSIHLPFLPEIILGDANAIITPFIAAVLGLTLNEGAYMSEIVRAGILSVDSGQSEAAEALGMKRRLILWRIILPQAMRIIIPPTGNQVIAMLKTTSLVSVISLSDLLYSTQIIISNTFQPIPLLIVAAIWYFILSTILTIGQFYLERRFSRGNARALPLTPWQQFTRFAAGFDIRPANSTKAQ